MGGRWSSLVVLGIALASSAAVAAAPPKKTPKPVAPDDPRYGLLTPIPDRGGVPPISSLLGVPSERELEWRARARNYEKQLSGIRRVHFGRSRSERLRAEGFERLREFTDPAAFRPMIEVTGGEADDVRLAVLDHLRDQGDEGQAALAWVAIHDRNDAIRNEAMNRMATPVSVPVLRVLDQALRSNVHRVASNAGWLSGAMNALETIPLLIFSQATRDPAPQDEGDLAWIAIQTERAYVQDLVPVVGDSSGAFMPVVGTVSEGIVLRVTDAVVIVYRTVIHRVLVSMTSRDWGHPTDDMGYDMRAWWEWYNTEYVPFKNRQRERAAGS
ncbi:MAG: hypothetical protein GY715_13755 [Planctomycetes bacterium]|nr:hypothetical protein [Planctomycetota bacterium]